LLYSKSTYFCTDMDYYQAKKGKMFKGEFRNASKNIITWEPIVLQ